MYTSMGALKIKLYAHTYRDTVILQKKSHQVPLILPEPKGNGPAVSVNRNKSTGSTAEEINKLKNKTKTKN